LDLETGNLVHLNRPASFSLGQVLQIGLELMTVLEVGTDNTTYSVVRGILGSQAVSHAAGDLVLPLDSSVIVVAFATGFFENRASSNYLHTLNLPDVRTAAAEFYVSNAFGHGQTKETCYTSLPDTGLRTLSGGQFSLQVSGHLATQVNASPPLIIEAAHAVRDLRATISQPATGYDIRIDLFQNGVAYQSLLIPSGETRSAITTNFFALPPLQREANLTMNITLNVLASPPVGLLSPGRDLTVTIRL
jgi:hypothetical protein